MTDDTDAITRKFVALDREGNPTAFAPGVPARDLTEAEWRSYVDAGLIVEGDAEGTTGALWEKVGTGGGGGAAERTDRPGRSSAPGSTGGSSDRKDGDS